jgi:hypothetical protein
MTGKPPPFAKVGSQAKFLEAQKNGTGVSHLFAYEDQTGLHRFLRERLGEFPALIRENVSPSLPLSLSPEVEHRLRRKCAVEFELYDSIAARNAM